MARRKSFLRSFISRGYKTLSILNTLSVVASGNPVRIGKHFGRKRAIGIASHVVPHSKKRR